MAAARARRVRFFGTPCRRSAILAASLAATALLLTSACGEDTPFQPSPPPVPCAYVVPTTPLSIPAAGGTAQVSVSTTAGCAWSARSETSWVSITAGASGTGSGTVTVTAAPNAATVEREGSLVIAGHTVLARQAGLAACQYEISPTSVSVGIDERSGSFSVTAADHCAWTAASGASWISVLSPTSGTGSGVVQYRVDRNGDPPGRQGSIAVAGLTFTVSQEGDVESCRYSVSPVTFAPCMPAAEMSAAIATDPGCPWTAAAVAGWIEVASGHSGSGTGTVTLRVTANWAPPRAGVVELRWPAPTLGQNLHIAQAGCSYAVSRDTFAFGADGGSAFLDVIQASDPITCGGPLQNACLWNAVSDASWITITTAVPRTGDDRLSFTVASNNGPARAGTVRVQDRVVQITQAAR
jgi:trimeric autotransporter adhesin